LLGDGEGTLWVGTETQGLLRYDLEGGTSSRVWVSAGAEVTALALGARGALWVGTAAALCRLDIPTSSATCFEAGSGPQSLASGTIQALRAQPNDALWIGTDAGLHRADVDDLEAGFQRYLASTTDLPDDDVLAIVEDGDGFLWLSTGAGLSRFEPLTETFAQRAGVADADRTLSSASTRAPDGRLYVGSTRGLLTFDPGQLAVVNGNPPQVVITDVEVSGQSTAPGDGVLEVAAPVADQITLGPSQGFLTIEYAGLHFSTPLQNTFRYRLDGLRQSEWQEVGTSREATYESLPPGRYTFQVQAANADGIGFADGARAAMASIEVVVNPPWWRTWWAITGFVLVGIAALVRADQWQRARLLRQERERAERREAELRAEAAEAEQREARAEAAALKAENDRKAAELEGKREVEAANAKLAEANGQLEASLRDLQQTQTQLVQSEKLASLGQLTAGIAHEIKNPLNFVNNFADLSVDLAQELREEMEHAGDNPTSGVLEDVSDLIEDLQENARRIREHGQRADRIVRSMLLHSRGGSAEKGRVDINRFVDEYANLAFHGARANDSDFQVEIVREFADDADEVEVVPQEFGRVLINLLTNAFHTVTERSALEGDAYRPRVTVATSREGSDVEVVVRDNGTGIPEAVKAKIFEPFFTTKPTGEGTGLGLSLAHDIVSQVHGGQMTVESTEGEGTAFHIVIPDRQPDK
ncbi:ATP-binding protein, partial [Rubrivirga sp.]|uniref:ATP-binding protein n=1 Tax=Rubrivirga sp. TaxID=1885344 RepID=UPI003C706E38